MKDWFNSLDDREQIFVSSGALIVILVLLYGLIWAPLDDKHQMLKADAALWKNSLTELRPLRSKTNDGGAAQNPSYVERGQSPIIIVDQTLQSRGLDRYRRRSQPTSSNGIRVEFENVAFDELVLWLGDLSQQFGMDVQAGSFSPGSLAVPGRVNATLTLERPL